MVTSQALGSSKWTIPIYRYSKQIWNLTFISNVIALYSGSFLNLLILVYKFMLSPSSTYLPYTNQYPAQQKK